MKPFLLIFAIFIVALIIGIPLLNFKLNSPIEKIPDSKVPTLETLYQDLQKDLVHGVLEAKFTSTIDINGRTLLICPITEGEVLMTGNYSYLECKNSSTKRAIIENSLTSIQLLSGTYFLDIEDQVVKGTALPAKVIIHKGEKALVEINFSPGENTDMPADYSASFEIYTNGTKRIFTDSKYHNKSKEVYIELPDPSLIHIKSSGVTWADFFATLPMRLTPDCLTTGTGQTFCTNSTSTLHFFVNDKENPQALGTTIKAADRLLVVYGNQ